MAEIRYRKIWQMAATQYDPALFTTAQVLADRARAYFQWCDDNPRYKTEIIKHKMEWDTVEVQLKRPYTMSGLCVQLGVANSYFRSNKAELMEKMEAGTITEPQLHLLATIEWIEQIVFTDQIEGAATGQYNANIVARINGLADNVNNANVTDPVLRIVTRDAETTANLNLLTAGL